MNYEDLKWMNQSLFSYKDKSFDSHGHLDISVSINTSDDTSFSAPKLIFNLDNQGQRRYVRLTYNDVVDLLDSFNYVFKNLNNTYDNPQVGDITKRYNSDKDFIFEFRYLPNTTTKLVSMKINLNHSDQGKIIYPLQVLVTIGNIIKMFEQNYVRYSLDLPSRYLSSLTLNRLNSIETLVKILPTQLIPIQPEYNIPDRGEYKFTDEVTPTGTKCSMCGEDQFDTPSGVSCKNGHGGAESISQNEFEQFSSENVDKVRIPELEGDILERVEPIIQGVISPFISLILKNNIHNMEEMIFALLTNNNPLTTIMDTIHKGQTYSLLPSISEQDLKSVFYLSNLFFKIQFQSYIQNQTAIPAAVPVIKYKAADVDRETIELSYDFLVISTYLKLYRNRMEAINSDPYTNGALVHFAFRCFLDVATFSYLSDTNNEAIKNCVLTRFKTFRESGFFDYYDKNLEKNRQQTITIGEVSEFIEKVFTNVVNSDNIDKRHFNAHDTGDVKLPPKNNFTPDQIVNEIVKYEVKNRFGQRIEDLTSSDEIILLFNQKIQKKFKQTDHRPEPRKLETHVLRYIKLKATEIPERDRNELIKYVEEMGCNQYDFINSPFKIEELTDVIIKSLYVWNNFLNDDIKYTDYVLKVEDCIDKDLIIAKVKEEPEKNENEDWSTAFGNIEL